MPQDGKLLICHHEATLPFPLALGRGRDLEGFDVGTATGYALGGVDAVAA